MKIGPITVIKMKRKQYNSEKKGLLLTRKIKTENIKALKKSFDSSTFFFLY